MRLAALMLLLFITAPTRGQEIADAPPALFPIRPMMQLPVFAQQWTLNTDGSCVQCSGCQVGLNLGDMNQATLLWDTEYGRAQRGGSGPDRVANYCRARGIEIYNVTGRGFSDTKPWMEWACQTGRFAAVGCFGSHFQTLYGRDYETDRWLIQNNWPGTWGKPYVYTESEFKRQHEASGAWVVIPKRPPPAPFPLYVKWWEDDSLIAVITPAVTFGPQFSNAN